MALRFLACPLLRPVLVLEDILRGFTFPFLFLLLSPPSLSSVIALLLFAAGSLVSLSVCVCVRITQVKVSILNLSFSYQIQTPILPFSFVLVSYQFPSGCTYPFQSFLSSQNLLHFPYSFLHHSTHLQCLSPSY